MNEVEEKKKRLEEGENPRDIKMELGTALVTIYHNDKEATLAKQSFIDTFQNGIIPEDVIVLEAEQGEELGALLVKAEIVESKAEFKRLIEQGAISTEDGTKIDDYKREATPEIYRVGKKRFAKVIRKE